MGCLFLPDQKKVSFSEILSASIYLTLRDQRETNFPVMFPKKQGEGWHSKRTIYTLKPFNNPCEKWLTSHKERIWKNTRSMWELRIHPHVQNTLSLQYTVWKTTKQKDNQNHVCILLHREALSVIRCVLLQAYSHWYLLQSGERKGQLCPQMAILSCK